jgi:hypothetical protein
MIDDLFLYRNGAHSHLERRVASPNYLLNLLKLWFIPGPKGPNILLTAGGGYVKKLDNVSFPKDFLRPYLRRHLSAPANPRTNDFLKT